jgi:hypothetical protein
MRYAPNGRRARSANEKETGYEKDYHCAGIQERNFQQKLTIGLDLGDRWSFYCVLDEAGQVILEQKDGRITQHASTASASRKGSASKSALGG